MYTLEDFIAEYELENYNYKEAIVGISTDRNVIYDYDKLIAWLMKRQPDWSELDAIE